MPRTSVKIWQRSARRAAARATAVVSLPPRPRVVISWSAADRALWPWKPATMTTLPPSSSLRTRARLDAGDARPAVRAVGGDAGLRPGQADGRRRRARGGPSTRASRSGARRSRAGRRARGGPGSSVMAAARPSSSSVVSPIADTTTTRSWPAARSRAIRRATRLMRSAPATDEPPNFWTTRGAGIARHSTVAGFGSPRPTLDPGGATDVLRPRQPTAHRADRRRRARRRASSTLTAADGNRLRGVPGPTRRADRRRAS